MSPRWVTIWSAIGLAWAASLGVAAEHTTDSLETVKEKVSAGKAVLIDVREQDEWDAGHLRDARLLALSRLKKGVPPAELAKLLPKDTIIYAHCRSGGRCLSAADTLKKAGYEVRPLKAGYQELLDAGFPKAEK